MNTKLLMTASAVMLMGAGVLLVFLPQEVGALFALSSQTSALLFQLLGALYFSFGMINWTARANLIGGIYARPIAIGNLSHFMIGSLSLMKVLNFDNPFFLISTMVYAFFAVLFGVVFFRHPVKKEMQ